jgi:transposase-like protein
MTEPTPSPLNNVITIDDDRIKNHLDRVVRGSVEETLNALLDAEADRLCNAQRYERSAARRDTRAGHYERNLQTKAGEVRLKVPKLRQQTFETAIIERYRRRESSVEEALIEMYLAGVSVRRVEDITEALWGTRVSPSTVSDLNRKIYGTIEAWRDRPIEGEHPYVYLDGIVLKRSWAGEVRNVSLLVAIAVNGEGYREILGICEGAKEDKAGWSAFLKHLKERGLRGVPADHLGRLPRACRECCRILPRGRLATLHRALVPQHLQPRALDQGAGDRGDAQGDPRGRGHRGGTREGHPSDREAARAAADQGCRPRRGGGRGDARLLRFP